MSRPVVLLNSWRRTFSTLLDPHTELEALNPSYIRGVRRAGGVPLIVPHPDPDELEAVLPLVDAVVITGGQDMDPSVYGAENDSSRGVIRESDDADVALFSAAVSAGLPILGICRGIQVVNVAMGGDLLQEVQVEGDPNHPTYAEMTAPMTHRHPVEVEADSRLSHIYGSRSISVNSLHHQAVGRVADGLRTVATSPDGVIEAVESEELQLLAVQWHPELLDPADGAPLFTDLVARASQARDQRVGTLSTTR